MDPDAAFKLGMCYLRGEVLAQSYKRAVELLRHLTPEERFVEGHYQLGRCLEEGHGVEKDEKEAARHYTIAADLGSAEAMNRLACLYGKG
jgi:hypothetical protein